MVQELLRKLWTSSFAKDTAKLSSGIFIAQLIAFAASPILTRLFTPDAFGTFSLIFATASIASVFSTMRLELLLPIVERPATALNLMRLIFVLSSAVALFLVIAIAVAGPQIAAFSGIDGHQAPLLYGVPILILITSAYLALRYWLIRKGRFGAIGKGQVTRAFLNIGTSLVLGVLAFPAQFPTFGLLAGQAAGDALFSGRLFTALTPRERRLLFSPRAKRLKFELKRRRAQIATLVSTQAVAALYGRLPLVVIGAAFGPVQVGWYALAERVCQAPSTLIASAIGDVYRQRASDAFRAGQAFDGLMRRVLGLTFAISAIPFAIAILLTPKYFGTVFGDAWRDAGTTVAIMLVSTFFSFNQSPVDKAALIHQANRYIYAWHGLRLIGECAGAALAITGYVDFIGYLAMVVACRAALAIWDLVVEYGLAKRSGVRIQSS